MEDFDVFLALQEATLASGPSTQPAQSSEVASRSSSQPQSSWSSTELERLDEDESRMRDSTRGFAVKQSPAAQCLEHVDGPELHPGYSIWSMFQQQFLGDMVKSRGKQLRHQLLGSVCTGTAPAKVNHKVFPKAARHVMSCDNSPPAVNFLKSNTFGMPTEHIFCCVKALALTMACFCLTCMCTCSLNIIERLDQWIGGMSCRPFSLSGKDRLTQGSLGHRDAILNNGQMVR